MKFITKAQTDSGYTIADQNENVTVYKITSFESLQKLCGQNSLWNVANDKTIFDNYPPKIYYCFYINGTPEILYHPGTQTMVDKKDNQRIDEILLNIIKPSVEKLGLNIPHNLDFRKNKQAKSNNLITAKKNELDFPVFEEVPADDHIDRRLQTQHEEPKNFITEEQLEDHNRFGEENSTIEKQLEKVRTGNSESLTEGCLNDNKKHRNSKAYEGNINKLEEKRVKEAKYLAEKEKYELSSSTPKSLRWWEEKLGKDQLKIASTNKYFRMANLVAEIDKDEDDEDEEIDGKYPRIDKYDLPTEDDELSRSDKKPLDWWEKNLSKDQLKTALNENDIEPNSELLENEEEFDIDNIEDAPVENKDDFKINDITDQLEFQEVEFQDIDAGGTPMVLGKIKFTGEVSDINKLLEQAKNYINEKHPEINLTENFINTDKISENELSFTISKTASKNSRVIEASFDFPIVIADDSKKN